MAHKKHPKKLFCTLANRTINKIPKQVENHFNSKRVQRLKELHDQKQEKRGKAAEKSTAGKRATHAPRILDSDAQELHPIR